VCPEETCREDDGDGGEIDDVDRNSLVNWQIRVFIWHSVVENDRKLLVVRSFIIELKPELWLETLGGAVYYTHSV
jgi:hypothetical protein